KLDLLLVRHDFGPLRGRPRLQRNPAVRWIEDHRLALARRGRGTRGRISRWKEGVRGVVATVVPGRWLPGLPARCFHRGPVAGQPHARQVWLPIWCPGRYV